MTKILDPTDENKPIIRRVSYRPKNLEGTIGLLDISKPRGNILIDRIQELLENSKLGITVKKYSKPTYTKPLPESLGKKIRAECDFVIEALAD